MTAAVRCPSISRLASKWSATVAYTPLTVTQSLSRSRTLQDVLPWRNQAKSAARGKPRSAPSVQRTPVGKACWSCWMSASVVARKRPLDQGYGITAQPIGNVWPATTMPASQTSHGPSRVVSRATTTG
jgi:hypothetical protein